MAISLTSLRTAYDVLTKMHALLEAARTYIAEGTTASEQTAIDLLTQACNVGLTFLPSGKIGLALQMSIDAADASQEANSCQYVSAALVQSIDSSSDNIINNLNSQSYSFSSMQQALFTDALTDAQSGNVQGAIDNATRALKLSMSDGSTVTEYPDGSLVISYTNADPTQSWIAITVSISTSWQATSIDTENTDNTSQILNYYGDGSSVTTHYAGQNASGAVTEVDANNANGTSEIIRYNPDGSSVISSWTEPNGMGELTKEDQENADHTSQITVYNPDGSSTTTDYTGPDGTGTITKIDQENSDGTSQITTFNTDGSSTTTIYSGPNGTGSITKVDIESPTSSIVSSDDPGVLKYTYTGIPYSIFFNPPGFTGTSPLQGLKVTGSVVVDPGVQPLSSDTGLDVPWLSLTDGITTYSGPEVGATGGGVLDGGFIHLDENAEVVAWDLDVVDGNYPGPNSSGIVIYGNSGTGADGDALFNADGIVAFNANSSAPGVRSGPIATTVVTISPLAGQTQQLSDVLANPALTAQGSPQSLVIDGPGIVEVDSPIPIANVEIKLYGSLAMGAGSVIADSVTVDAGGNVSGYGTMTGGETVDGKITASGGPLDIRGSIGGSGTLTFEAGSSLVLEGSVAATESLIFNGSNETLLLGSTADVLASASGLGAGDAIGLKGETVTTAVYDPVGNALSITGSSGSSFDLALVGTYHQSDFAVQNGEVQVLCFLRGTLIAAPAGEVPVEQLAVGDPVLTATGDTRRIVWVGVGQVLATRGQRSAATSVIVRRGALADNVPCRDLHVTKGHSLFIDGVLIPVECLINHRSILWDDRSREVTVYHIELETHDVLIADGAPAESYRDDGNRWLFRNANSGWGLPPQEPCAPVLTGGPLLDAIWRRLVDRAGPRNSVPLTDDLDLHLLVDGKRMDALEKRADAYVFRLPARPHKVSIRSRSAVPKEVGLARDDRSLGVAIRRIVLAQARGQRAIEAEAESLSDGFHTYEIEHGIRWTDGDAAVPSKLFAGMTGPGMLMLHLGVATQYPDEGCARQVA